MITEVTRYQTTDGMEFKTEQAARRHEDDQLCEKLDTFFKHWLGDSPRHEIYKAVCAATDNRALLMQQLHGMLRILETS